MGEQTVAMEYELPHPPAKVWRALTEPELMKKWLMATDMQPQVGNSFTFRADPVPGWDGVIDCEVLALEPQKKISYSWRSLGVDTVVTWTLTKTDAGTRLSLEHTGAFPPRAFGGARKGWEYMAGVRLPTVLESLTQ